MNARSASMLLVALVATTLHLGGCSAEAPAAGDVCEQATQKLDACGVSLPVTRMGACVGTREALARCLVTYANGCAELATIMRRADECVADMMDGGTLDDFEAPIVSPDAAVGQARDASADAPRADAGRSEAGTTTSPDADAPREAAAPDAGPAWPFTVTDTVGASEERRYETPLLAAGTYRFVMTGSGDADLYVKKGAAPSVDAYNCRPFRTDSNESCVLTISTDTVFHMMVRGSLAASTFTLEAKP